MTNERSDGVLLTGEVSKTLERARELVHSTGEYRDSEATFREQVPTNLLQFHELRGKSYKEISELRIAYEDWFNKIAVHILVSVDENVVRFSTHSDNDIGGASPYLQVSIGRSGSPKKRPLTLEDLDSFNWAIETASEKIDLKK